jgi:hypothetical protein
MHRTRRKANRFRRPAASPEFGEKGLIDLVATMGYYDTVAMTLITAKAVAPKEDDVPQLAALPR